MKNSFIDMTGKRIGMFTVIKRGYTHKQPSGQTKLYWECLCDCGKTFYASGTNIRNGHYLSCGCMREEMSKKGQFRKTHGMAKTRLYEIWAGMKKRCDKEKFVHYSRYGGRGIRYCKEWERFEPFMEWSLANGYSDDLTLDRINNDGNYEPSNCRWVTMQEQANNTSRNRMIEIDGVTHSVSEWARVFGIKPELALHRLNMGWDERDIFQPPKRINGKHFVTYNGKTQTIKQWGEETGINPATISQRLKKGLPLEKVFSDKKNGGKYITFNGETKTVTEWAKCTGINSWVISSRLINGWDIEDIFNIPVGEISKYKSKNNTERG